MGTDQPVSRNGALLWLLGCNLIVFCSNICIMVLELTASRLLAHLIGQSLYTWTGVIGVVLAGITIGNYVGGYLSDRYDHLKLLAALFFAAAVTTAASLQINGWMANVRRPESWGWPLWVLVVVAVIFLLPAVVLGAISPVVASLALSRSRRVGFTVGNVYAWAALGSIVGTFLAGFVLIDHVGTRQIILWTAVALLVMAAVPGVLLLGRARRRRETETDLSVSAEPASPGPVEPEGTWLFLMGCNLVVFTTSIGIMTLELTATRLLAHHIGQSLYTWTSVIAVVLAGITIGNYIGGLLADRFDHRSTLGWLFLFASVLCFSVLWLDQASSDWSRGSAPTLLVPVLWLTDVWFTEWSFPLNVLDEVDWRAWIIAQVAGVYGPPAVAMGTISPVVAALALSRSRRTGVTVGNVYAWSTLGSIIGTFLAGFWLIDLFGTRALIVLIAAMLGIAGAYTAPRGSLFRPMIVFGWLQFLLFFGLATAVTDDVMGTAGGVVGRVLSVGRSDPDARLERVAGWQDVGTRVGRSFHDLGTNLALRSDEPGQYEDESNYSYITVVETTDEDGKDYKYLKLDKLVHSYYYPGDPMRLEYQYELVYAAVTERSTHGWKQAAVSRVAAFPGREALVSRLPAGVRFDPGTEELQIDHPLLPAHRDALLTLSPFGNWWLAIDELHRLSSVSGWNNFAAADLPKMPEGVEIPAILQGKSEESGIVFHPNLQVLTTRVVVDDTVRGQLVAAAPMKAWYDAVQALFTRSRRVRTMFIGGGGFVFPRWIEARFPHEPVIDVAELDPAVLGAVQDEMGLAKDGLISRSTRLGDARNFVDDQVRRVPKPQYDFIYGDAFNDFSVPWHLTTEDFTSKVRQLLDPERGVYLVNIIDIYPRIEAPEPGAAGTDAINLNLELDSDDPLIDEPTLSVDLPDGWAAMAVSDEWRPVPGLPGVEVFKYAAGQFRLAVRGEVPDDLRARMLKEAAGNDELKRIIGALCDRSHDVAHSRRRGRFLASYALTVAKVFPNVYVFSSEIGVPHESRDTFVIIGSNRPLDLSNLNAAGKHWSESPFAWQEDRKGPAPLSPDNNQWESLTWWARRTWWRGVLTDNFAPVDRLLSPVFLEQDD